MVKRTAYMVAGWIAVALGIIGLFLPIMPTVPFMILAAFFFSRGAPHIEQKLLDDPRFGPHIRAWRERGAISRLGKTMALLMLSGSAVMGLWILPVPYCFVPLAIAVIAGSWIATRPTA